MNNCCAHCIAKHANKAVGYALGMHPKFADGIEVLKPMFAENIRSLNAHLAISFEILKEYGANNKHWIIISLNCSGHLPDIT